MRAWLIIISLFLGACSHTIPNREDKCIQVYRDGDVMKYREVDCATLFLKAEVSLGSD